MIRTFQEILKYREMIVSLVRKDLRGRYKGSVLGFFWTFINPLLQLLVYNMVFSVILRAGVEKFYLYLFVALIPWIFFSAALTGGSVSVISQKDLINKIYFPREVIPISYVTSCFVNMLLSFIVVIAVSLISGVRPGVLAFICLPVIMIVEYVLAVGIALIVSALTVYLRDLEHILGIISMAWMYATPICYPMDIVPEEYKALFRLNPMTDIINAYRAILYEGRVPDIGNLWVSVVLGIVCMIVGFLIFGRLQKRFAEEL